MEVLDDCVGMSLYLGQSESVLDFSSSFTAVHCVFQVLNGEEASSGQSLGKYCGNRTPLPIKSEEGSIVLKFKSDDTVHTKGFSAVYRHVGATSGESHLKPKA